jgi:predicted translin family RNA/ssDNA-binding protein
MITENQVKDILDKILLEETSKVRRDDYNRVQYRIEELQNSLNETLKEFRKVNDTLPDGLKTVSNGRMSSISGSLNNAQKLIGQLKEKIKQHKRSTFSQQVEEKKK